MEHGRGDRLDFFLSYAPADKAWAVWIAWILEEDGFRVKLQAWDSPAGSNWIKDMDAGIQEAARTIAVLSPSYLESGYLGPEWQAAWAQSPGGEGQKLLPVRVSNCAEAGLLAGIVSIDLFGIDEGTARRNLRENIEGAVTGRQKPTVAPEFPGGGQPGQPPFPGFVEPGLPAEPAGEAAGAAVTDISAYRRRISKDSAGAPVAKALHELIGKLSHLAEEVGESYDVDSPAFLWRRLEVEQLAAPIELQLDQVTEWLDRVRRADDPDTFSLRYALRLHASAAEEFAQALASLAPARSSTVKEGLIADYEAAWRSLLEILGRIYRELEVALKPRGPAGLR